MRTGQNNESATLIASLRETIQKQVQEIASLQQQLKQSTASTGDEVIATFGV